MSPPRKPALRSALPSKGQELLGRPGEFADSQLQAPSRNPRKLRTPAPATATTPLPVKQAVSKAAESPPVAPANAVADVPAGALGAVAAPSIPLPPADAQALYGVEADERVLLQGVVDACFLEDGGWTIVDYKTDRVRPGESAEQAAKRHETQMRLYALAVEAITGQPVRERLVVLLSHRAVVAL